jgi:hypothetical protein
MAEYAGSAIAACFGGVQFPNMRTLRINPTRSRAKLDATSAGDASKQSIDDIIGQSEWTVTVSGWYDQGDTFFTGGAASNLGEGATFVGYPEGAPAAGGKPQWTGSNFFIESVNKDHTISTVNTYEATLKNLSAGSLVYSLSASYA